MPNFWLGYLLIIVLSLQFGLLPVAGNGGLSHLVLPAVTLGTGMNAIITRLVRMSLLEVLDEPYVEAARSKGLSERIVVYKHAMRNALVPVMTVVGLQLGFLLSGAVVVETVFQRPGLGVLLVDAVFARDYPVIQGAVLVVVMGSIRKDGLLLLQSDGLSAALSAMTPVQVLTAVYLAGVLLPCLVTAITVAKELSPRYAGRMLFRQATAAIGFSLLIGWGGAVLS